MSEGHDHDGAGSAYRNASPAEAVQSRLRDLADLPVSEHVTVFEDVHRELHGALREDGHAPAGEDG